MRHKYLVEQIFKANAAYRLGKPIMSDEEYDILLDQLKAKDQRLYDQVRPLLFDPVQTKKKETVKLPVVVGSLEKLKNGFDEEIRDWDLNQHTKEYVISSKVDGLSLLLCYYNGELKMITTRGDGIYGENKTRKLGPIVPKLLYGPLSTGLVIIRGEGVLTDDAFKALNHEKGFSYRAKRSAVVGLVNADSDKHFDLAQKYITFIAYQIYKSDVEFKTYSEVLKMLEKNYFYTPKAEIIKAGSLNSKILMDLYEEHISDEDFDIDGLVIQNNECFNEYDKLLPEHSIAFKANKLIQTTKIEDYEWDVSKDGSLRPVAIVSPIRLNGVTVNKASAFNSDWIEESGAGIGAKVVLQMQGDIIPGIVQVLEKSDDYKFPDKCPFCGSKINRYGKFHYCSNNKCQTRLVKSLAYFLRNLEIAGISYVSLLGWNIHTYKDLLAFEFDPASKNQMNFKRELAKKLWNRTEEELVLAFDYNGIGSKTIQKIIDANSFDKFIERFFSVNADGWVIKTGCLLKTCPGVTENTFKKIEEAVKENDLVGMYLSLTYDSRYKPVKKVALVDSVDLGKKSFCFTGALSIPRKVAENLVKERNGEIRGSVSSALDYLVTNTPDSNSAKNKKAKELGVKVIDEKEFFKIIEYTMPENIKVLSEVKKEINVKLPYENGFDEI